MNPLRLYRPELQMILEPGESLSAAALCQRAIGADRLERSPGELEHLVRSLPERLRGPAVAAMRDEPRPERRWERVAAVLIGADSIIRFDTDEAIGGVAAAGHVDSCAARLAAAFGTRSGIHCVVTDHRLILAELTLDPVGFTPLADLPVTTVLAARREGRFLQRGRIVLDFVDMSQLALLTGVFGAAPANALVAALTPPR